MTDIEREFTNSCLQSISECKKNGYNPTVWIRMIAEYGAVSTAKKLIKSGDLQSGLIRLLSLGRSDLTIESMVIDERWSDLFTDDERELAQWRLNTAHETR